MKLDKAVFRYVEFELYHYNENKKTLDELKQEIMHQTPFNDGQPRGSDITDSTAKKAVKMVTTPAIVRIERTTRAIERALAKLPEEHNNLFQLKYIQNKPWQTVCDEMPTSERSYFRYRRELVNMVALELGLVNSL